MMHWANVTDLHKRDVAAMAGGVFSGGTAAILRYADLHDQVTLT